MERENEFDVMNFVIFATKTLDEAIVDIRAMERRLTEAAEALSKTMEHELEKLRVDFSPEARAQFDRIAADVAKIDQLVDAELLK
tara:strand:- start:60 stop:314 length:255 start_codon:yes stop_codon:yes gene_type:complete